MARKKYSEIIKYRMPLITEDQKLYSEKRQEYLSSKEFDDYFYPTLREFYSQGIAIMSEPQSYEGDELINDAKKNSEDFLQLLRDEKAKKAKNYKENIATIKRLILSYNYLVVASRAFLRQDNPELIEHIDVLLDMFVEDKLDLQIVKAIKTLDEIWKLLT